MTRVGIDPKYKGGSIRMAAASAAIDRGVPRCNAQHRPMGQLAGLQSFLQPSSSGRCGPEPSIGLTLLA